MTFLCDLGVTYVVVQRFLTTTQVAQKLGIHRVTLQKWIRLKRVNAPSPIIHHGRSVRLWSPKAIQPVRELIETKEWIDNAVKRAKAHLALLKEERNAQRLAEASKKQ